MRAKICVPALIVLSSLAVAGCANDGMMGSAELTTSSLPKKEKVDPACVALSARIDELKQEGTVGRVEQAASGKSKNVVIKRASLSKVAELNQAFAEFQSKCSTVSQQAKKPAGAATTAAVTGAAQTAAAAAKR
jgi:hypothetical protein